MESPRPRLVTLAPGQEAPEQEAAAPAPPRPLSRISVALVLLLVLAAGGLLAQTWRASRLAAEVASLEGQLGDTREALQAHEAHLERVREAVAGVQREVQALGSLVEPPPEASTP
ncbi:MAG: hypothetical protein ABFS46_02890 [Myxococcota bacterium]